MAELRGGLDDALAGRGGVVLITGEAGIGKTRLVEELAEVAASTPARLVWGRCWEGGGAAPYWPWTQVLRTCGNGRGYPEGPALLAPSADAAPELPGARSERFRAVVELLSGLAAEAPLVLAFDDLHAADDASLQLMKDVAAAVADSPMLVLGTYREAEAAASPVRRRLLDAVAAHGRSIRLTGLDETGVSALLERAGVASAGAASLVHDRTDGNPFFVQEMARLLVTTGGAAAQLPEHVREVVLGRLEPLDRSASEMIAVGSVLGREFDARVVAAVSGSPVDAVLDLLAEAERAQVVAEVGLGRWSFAHALLRDAVYEQLPEARRVDVHRRAAEALEALHGEDLDDHLASLAHHFWAAGDAERAREYGTRAAGRAMAMLAYEDAASLYRRALDGLAGSPRNDPSVEFELLLGLSSALRLRGDLPAARSACRRALRLARRSGSPELLGRAALGYAGFSQGLDLLPVLEEALAALPDADSALKAQLLLKRAWVQHADIVRHLDSIRAGNRLGVEMARRLGEPALLRRALFQWVQNSFSDLDALDGRLTAATELVELEQHEGAGAGLFLARSMLVGALHFSGDLAGARHHVEMLRREAAAGRSAMFRWVATSQHAFVHFATGELAAGEQLAREARAIGLATGFHAVEGLFTQHMVMAAFHRGDFAELADLARRRLDEVPLAIHCGPADLALALALQGDTEQARAEMESMLAGGLAPERFGPPRLCCPARLAAASWELGDAEYAAILYDLLEPYAGRHITLPDARSHGSCDRYLGQLACLLGRYDSADAHFEDAHRMHDRMGARAWAAHGRADHGRMLLERGRAADRHRAGALLASARAAFRSLGMEVFAGRAAALLPEPPPERSAVLRHEGDDWVVQYGDRTVRVRNTKGMHHLAELLRNPGVPLQATRLAGEVDAERARHSVTRAVRTAIGHVAAAHPALGEHLRARVRTGSLSAYEPDERAPMVWEG